MMSAAPSHRETGEKHVMVRGRVSLLTVFFHHSLAPQPFVKCRPPNLTSLQTENQMLEMGSVKQYIQAVLS